jgi:hypothetical protein
MPTMLNSLRPGGNFLFQLFRPVQHDVDLRGSTEANSQSLVPVVCLRGCHSSVLPRTKQSCMLNRPITRNHVCWDFLAKQQFLGVERFPEIRLDEICQR